MGKAGRGYAGETSDEPSVRRWVRGALLVGSIGLALHLVLAHMLGIERSLRLVVGRVPVVDGADVRRPVARKDRRVTRDPLCPFYGR